MSYYRVFSAHKGKPPDSAKPIRIEKKMVHGQLVEVKIYAQVGTQETTLTVRPRAARNRA